MMQTSFQHPVVCGACELSQILFAKDDNNSDIIRHETKAITGFWRVSKIAYVNSFSVQIKLRSDKHCTSVWNLQI